MTVSYKSKELFRGVPMRKVRDILRDFNRRQRPPAAISLLKSIDLKPPVIYGILQEALDLGWIVQAGQSDREFELTPSGSAVAYATGSKRTPKRKAWQKLQEVLSRCAEANQNPKCPITVEEIWVFGSLIDDTKADVGDIDIVPVTKIKGETSEEFWALASAYLRDRGYPDLDPYYYLDAKVEKKVVFGRRKDPIFSEIGVHTLSRLHVPCKLVFDKERGIVDDPVLPHLPGSKERSPEIKEKLVMPAIDKVQETLEPVSVDFITGHWRTIHTAPILSHILELERQGYGGFYRGEKGFSIMRGEGHNVRLNWNEGPHFCLQRSITSDCDIWTVDYRLNYGGGNARDIRDVKNFVQALLLMRDADVWRLIKRRNLLGQPDQQIVAALKIDPANPYFDELQDAFDMLDVAFLEQQDMDNLTFIRAEFDVGDIVVSGGST